MKVIRFDSIGGASGDMILAALHGLGVSLDGLEAELKKMSLDPFHLSSGTVKRRGIQAVKVHVHLESEVQGSTHAPPHDHHAHAHHHGEQSEPHSHAQGHTPHRHLHEIETLIRSSSLPAPVQEMAGQVFRRLGEAEAGVHGIPIEQVHFHEVGAMDSIIDIIGCCLALHRLRVDAVLCGPLPLGSGSFTCAHGTYPLPAPATWALLKGFPVQQTEEPFELVTPTGAALLSTWRRADLEGRLFRPEQIAYGAGQRDLAGRPNVLRATLGELDVPSEGDFICVLETNLDDASPECLGVLSERLMNAGALDVSVIPCLMKKNRPGCILQVQCEEEKSPGLERMIFLESPALGIRRSCMERSVLLRSFCEVETEWGAIRIKVAVGPDGRSRGKPEIEDCRKWAEAAGVPLPDVVQAAVRAYENQ